MAVQFPSWATRKGERNVRKTPAPISFRRCNSSLREGSIVRQVASRVNCVSPGSRPTRLGPPEGRGFRGCGKTLPCCHPERSEGPLYLNLQANTEVLPSFHSGPASPPQDDSVRGLSAACSAPPFQFRGEKSGLIRNLAGRCFAFWAGQAWGLVSGPRIRCRARRRRLASPAGRRLHSQRTGEV